MRDFVGLNGQTIQAKLVSHKAGKVTLERADGKQFEVEPSVFQLDDQVFIRDWMKGTPEDITYRVRVEANKEKVDGNFNNLGYKRVKNERWAYRIKVTNASRDAAKDLTVRYRIFHTNMADGEFSAGSDRSVSSVTNGEIKVREEIPYNRTLEFLTVPVQLDFVDYDGTGSRYKDEMEGVLVRVVDPKGNVVLDWSTTGSSMKNRTWENSSGIAQPVIR